LTQASGSTTLSQQIITTSSDLFRNLEKKKNKLTFSDGAELFIETLTAEAEHYNDSFFFATFVDSIK